MSVTTVDAPEAPTTTAPRTSRSWRDIGAGVRTWPVALGVVVASWNTRGPETNFGVDDSWRWALVELHARGARFGSEVAFTYGPWGILDGAALTTTAQGWTIFAVHVLVAYTVAWLVVDRCRGAGLPVAVLVAYLATRVVVPTDQFADAAVGIAAALTIARLLDGHRPSARMGAALGALAGLLLTVKASTGVAVAAFAAVVLVGAWATSRTPADPSSPPGSRRGAFGAVAAAAGALPVTFLAAWFAAGQRLGDLGDYIAVSREYMRGYGQAMAVTDPGLWILKWVAGALAAAGAVWLWRATRPVPTSSRVVALIVAAGATAWAYQASMVRADPAHTADFFALAIVVVFAATPLLGHVRTAALVVVAAVALIGSAGRIAPSDGLPGPALPIGSMTSLLSELRLLASPAALADYQVGLRRDLATANGLQPETVALLDGVPNGVHIATTDALMGWLHPEIDWRSAPGLQHYAALTPDLDERNAAFFAAPDRPGRILYKPFGLDGRAPAWESPAATLEIYCRYQQIHADPVGYAVLEADGAQCAAPQPLGRYQVREGEPFTVPTACAGAVTVRTTEPLAGNVVARLVDAVSGYPRLDLVVDGTPARLVPAVAGQPLIVATDVTWLGPLAAPAESGSRTLALTWSGTATGWPRSFEVVAECHPRIRP